MVWLYLPEWEGSTLESISLCHNQELFVMSRGKPMRPQYWQNKWKKGGFIRRLFGLTLSPSTANLGVEKWISSLEVSPASHGVSQGNKKELRTSDGYGTILKESFARFNQDSYSWRTSQASLMGDYLPYSSPWPKSGSMLNGALYERPMLAQIITEIEYSFSHTVPTPTLAESKNSPYQTSNGKRYPTTLGYVQMFPTPTAQEAQKAGKYAKGQMGQSLSAMAKRGQLFNTPTTRDGANATLPPSQANWGSLTGDMIRLGEARPGGVLNPEWVEWLMNWPIGWTDLEHAETESSHFKQESHIQSSSIELSKGGA